MSRSSFVMVEVAVAVLLLGAAFGMSARTGATNGAGIYDLVSPTEE